MGRGVCVHVSRVTVVRLRTRCGSIELIVPPIGPEASTEGPSACQTDARTILFLPALPLPQPNGPVHRKERSFPFPARAGGLGWLPRAERNDGRAPVFGFSRHSHLSRSAATPASVPGPDQARR